MATKTREEVMNDYILWLSKAFTKFCKRNVKETQELDAHEIFQGLKLCKEIIEIVKKIETDEIIFLGFKLVTITALEQIEV